ncbi:aromatic-ring-hydroxylating dioxygenase subunit beta [Gordoniibacillus kamchatkensis]|uniref:aromatic-ring-hydroxylating dioxygenase subunit beta n=1 Tax=Gordoniibacillus kamchatkensis TaxID=1590651 RepID=UPI000ACE9297|nr:aromatic-ring-hydroxylating dioxygenase subunit beta [Paenibacillus sp. VKM B-2647]
MNEERMIATFMFEQWLYKEAELLDAIDFDGWFALLHPDIQYRMPVRVNKEGIERPDYSTDMYAFQDDTHTLKCASSV